MSYVINVGRDRLRKTPIEVPDGQWVVEDVYWERHYGATGGRPNAPDLRDAEVIGLGDQVANHYCECGSCYRNGGGGESETEMRTIVSSKPFAVVQYHGISDDHVCASVWSARQIHKGELGRYPTLQNLPGVVCLRRDYKSETHEFVKWSDVAAAYGEADLHKLWEMYMPFHPAGHNFVVTYERTDVTGRVHYPRRCDGPPVTYWSEEYQSPFPDEARIEQSIADRHLDKEMASSLRMRNEKYTEQGRINHEREVTKVRERTTIPRHILWDDPVLQFEHLCVPISFARSVLICKRFGYVPDFKEAMAAVARHRAQNKAS